MKKNNLLWLAIGILFLTTTIWSQKTNTTVWTAQSKEGQQFLQKLQQVYHPYSRISASFTLKGMINDAEVYFLGDLVAKNGKNGKAEYLSIVLKDSVFEAKVYQLIINKETVTNIDYLNDKKEVVALSRFTWAQVLGSVFPFRFFYPLLSGFPPAEVYTGNIFPNQQKIVNEQGKYGVAVTLKDFIMDNIYVKLSRSSEDVLVFRMNGKLKNSRHFPKQIFMERSKNNDKITVIFRHANIK